MGLRTKIKALLKGSPKKKTEAEPGLAARESFYRPSISCQIPELATLYEIYFGKLRDGSFVEVGAYDGESFSNTSCLGDLGWRGLLVEPIPEFAQLCRNRHAKNSGIHVIECAIGSVQKQIELAVAGPLSTTKDSLLDAYQQIDWAKEASQAARKIRVPQITLDSLLSASNIRPDFDLLVVDVEGGESDVFAGFSLYDWRPRMLIVELVHTHPDLSRLHRADFHLQEQICNAGYAVAYKDCINTVFVSGQFGKQGDSAIVGSSLP